MRTTMNHAAHSKSRGALRTTADELPAGDDPARLSRFVAELEAHVRAVELAAQRLLQQFKVRVESGRR